MTLLLQLKYYRNQTLNLQKKIFFLSFHPTVVKSNKKSKIKKVRPSWSIKMFSRTLMKYSHCFRKNSEYDTS